MSDIPLKPDESPKNACLLNGVTRTLSPEQLRRCLSDHRNKLKDVRWNLLAQVKTLEREIAAADAMLAELTMD